MIFKRRDKPPFWGRLREVLYPRKGFWRGMDYVRKRLHRLPDSPHRIALGFAFGAFISFTPFFTLHFFLAAGLAWIFRANILASIFGTVIGNSLTFPLIATGSLWLGRYMLGRGASGESSFEAVTHAFAAGFSSLSATMQSWFGYGPSMLDGLMLFLDDVFLPYLIGGIPPGILCAVICYWIIGPIVEAYQARRSKKLAANSARARRAAFREQEAYKATDGREGDNV
ncbi:MAG: DUF2062 domain-containing protein [Hyphomicrobiales bacterium]|nr:MAG: DUF2062 domain-containing protein [Hyphomicrobiales bacterium]